MQRSLLLVIAAVIVLATGLGWLAQSPANLPASPPNDAARSTPPAAEPQAGTATVEDPAAGAARRHLVEESAVAVTNVLRVVLEGVTEEDARSATVTVAAVDRDEDRASEIRDSWQCRGPTSEFELDPLLAVFAERGETANVDELEVEVDHPHYLRESVRVSLARDAAPTDGRTVYEVAVRLERPQYWPEFSLSVRDANTLVHLGDVELRSSPGAGMARWGWNPVRYLIGDGLRSPIVLMGGRDADEPEAAVAHVGLRRAAGESPRLVHLEHHVRPGGRGVIVSARAPGYAQGSIVLDLSESEDRELLLEPGGAIDVRLANVQLERYRALGTAPMLCVYWIRKDGGNQYVHFQPLDEALATVGLQLGNLKPGGYRVTVELGGGSWAEQPVLAREELAGEDALVAGETRTMVLTLADPPAPPGRATLGGTVSFPTFGGEKNVRLQLYFQPTQKWRNPDVEFALADLQRAGGAPPSWSFRAADLPLGTYRVQLLPFLKVWMIELPAGGREDLQLVVPELAEVVVETVDRRTGERVPLDESHFRRAKPLPGQKINDRARADTEEPGRFRFWTAPGVVSIWPRGQDRLGYGRTGRDVELVPGRQSVRFELAPACLIRFDIRVDGTAPRLSDDIWGWVHYGTLGCVRAVDHEGRSMGRAGERLTEVSAPGVYEVDFADLTRGRFHPIPPRLVAVRAGETAEVLVELRRK